MERSVSEEAFPRPPAKRPIGGERNRDTSRPARMPRPRQGRRRSLIAFLALIAVVALGGCAVAERSGETMPASISPAAGPADQVGAAASGDPYRLLGLDSPGLERALGPPSFTRVDPPAEVWQYAGDTCILYLFLYDGEGDRIYRVTHYEIRGAGLTPAAQRRCLADIIADRRAGSADPTSPQEER